LESGSLLVCIKLASLKKLKILFSYLMNFLKDFLEHEKNEKIEKHLSAVKKFLFRKNQFFMRFFDIHQKFTKSEFFNKEKNFHFSRFSSNSFSKFST